MINRVPISVLDFQTPLDTLPRHISLPTVLKLSNRVFGCVVYVHVPFHQQSKLDPYALRCMFVGYGLNKKGHKCYQPPTQKFFVTTDATFHEDVSYFVVSKLFLFRGKSGVKKRN